MNPFRSYHQFHLHFILWRECNEATNHIEYGYQEGKKPRIRFYVLKEFLQREKELVRLGI